MPSSWTSVTQLSLFSVRKKRIENSIRQRNKETKRKGGTRKGKNREKEKNRGKQILCFFFFSFFTTL